MTSTRTQRALQGLAWVMLVLAPPACGLPLYEFFPFGVANGDTLNPTDDDGGSGMISLGANFPFFNRSNDRLYVNNNGIISFLGSLSVYTPSSFPLNDQTAVIAPFWADVDLRIAGTASHRETTNRTLLASASDEIRSYFPDFQNFSATWLYIATWNDTAFFGAQGDGRDKRNTFQCVLVTDGVHSFAILNYNKIQWLTGTASDGSASTGQGGIMANAGFNAGDRQYYASVQGAMTPAMLTLPSTSNVGIPGKWVYRVDLAKIELPPSPPSTRAPPSTSPFVIQTSTMRGLGLRDAIALKCGSSGFDVSVNVTALQSRESTDVRHIILGTSDCNGSMAADTLHFTAKYGDCLSTVKTFGDWLEFAVPLFYRESDPGSEEFDAVRWSLGLTCKLRSSEVDSALLPAIHFNNTGLLNSTFVGSLATVQLYTDSAFSQPLTSSPELGQTIFARVTSSMTVSDGTILVVRNCSVLPDQLSHATPPAVLLRDSCEVHSHTFVLATRAHETRFRFDAFGFTQGGATRVSCDVRVCSDSDFSDECSQRCVSRPAPPPPADHPPADTPADTPADGDVTRAHVIVLFERDAREP